MANTGNTANLAGRMGKGKDFELIVIQTESQANNPAHKLVLDETGKAVRDKNGQVKQGEQTGYFATPQINNAAFTAAETKSHETITVGKEGNQTTKSVRQGAVANPYLSADEYNKDGNTKTNHSVHFKTEDWDRIKEAAGDNKFDIVDKNGNKTATAYAIKAELSVHKSVKLEPDPNGTINPATNQVKNVPARDAYGKKVYESDGLKINMDTVKSSDIYGPDKPFTKEELAKHQDMTQLARKQDAIDKQTTAPSQDKQNERAAQAEAAAPKEAGDKSKSKGKSLGE